MATHRRYRRAQTNFARHVTSASLNDLSRQCRQHPTKVLLELRCRRRPHQRCNDNPGRHPLGVKQLCERRELGRQRMSRKAGCEDEPDNPRVRGCDLDRDRAGKRLTENDDTIVRQSLPDMGNQLIVNAIGRIADDKSRTRPRQLRAASGFRNSPVPSMPGSRTIAISLDEGMPVPSVYLRYCSILSAARCPCANRQICPSHQSDIRRLTSLKTSLSFFQKSCIIPPRPASLRGRTRRHGRRVRDAVDALMPLDERQRCGRRSRVVLASRC